MNNEQFWKCPLCQQGFVIKKGTYPDKTLTGYKLSVCETCYRMNWDGWAPHYEKILIEHCLKNDIPLPQREENGLLPRDFHP